MRGNAHNTAGAQICQLAVISGLDSTVEAGVTKMMFLFAQYNDSNVVRNLMMQSLAGEITIPNND